MPHWLPFPPLLATVVLVALGILKPSLRPTLWRLLAVAAPLALCFGAFLGLRWAPPDREMGDVQRIMYVHVPAVWMTLLALTLNFGCSITYLMKGGWGADALGEASAAVGVFFGTVGVFLGAVWGRPTWGVYWTWDPRLTTAAIALVVYTGYLALRRFVDDPDRRAVWSAVVGIVAFADIPIIWYSVRWWRSLHQVQSTPKTVDPEMTLSLRWNSAAFLLFLVAFLWRRYRLAMAERQAELAPPPAPALEVSR